MVLVYPVGGCHPAELDGAREDLLAFQPPVASTEFRMGPILSRNHWAAFVEAVLPVAVYYALRSQEGLWLYSSMAAALYASVIACASRAGTALCTAGLMIVSLLLAFRRRLAPGSGRLFVPIAAALATDAAVSLLDAA